MNIFKKYSFDTETVGGRIKLAIHSRGKTPAIIERETGVSKSYISRAINNKISSPKKLIRMISTSLKISENWILTGEGTIDEENESSIKIYHITNEVNEGSISVKNINEDIRAWKGFNIPPYNEESILITKSSNNSNGDYIIKMNDTYHIASRFNTEYSADWFFRGEPQKIHDISKYLIIGLIITTIIDENIVDLEVYK